jgi:hypothetical protein
MKNFKYPLALKITNSLRLSVRSALIELGYEWASDFDGDHIEYPFLCTSYHKEVGPHTMGNDYAEGGCVTRIKIEVNDKQSKKFALAVAAMRNERWEDGTPRFFEGESIVATDSSSSNGYIEGRMYTVKCDQPNEHSAILTVVDEKGSTINGWHHFRKATYEEISSQFGRTKKRVREYKYKPGYEEKFKRTVNHILCSSPSIRKTTISVGSEAEQLLREHDVLDLWFDLEESEEYVAGDWVVYTGVEGDGHGYNKVNRVIQLLPKDKGQYDPRHISGLCKDTNDDFVCFVPERKDKYFRISKAGIERLATPEEIEFENNLKLKTFTLKSSSGEFSIQVSTRGIYYAPDKTFLDPHVLNRICTKAEMSSEKVGDYTFSYTHVDSGCKKNVPVSNWKEVLNYYFSIVKQK